ncbi:MAG: hypothetical protein K5896_09640 [Prevotella sp.]|nr:hypothetical protein [Prevotella sp.]
MKALKLILIALVMAGALTGLMLLNLSGDSEEKTTPEQEALYSKLQKKIDNHWDSDEWNLTQFNSDYIMLNKQKEELGRQYFTSLTDQLNANGNKALYQYLKNAYARPDCTREDIDALMDDMSRFLQKASGYDKDKLVKEMQATYSLYIEALALATSSFYRTPTFDMASNSFSPSFRKYKNEQLKLANEIQQSELFANICNIEEVKQGLSTMPTRLSEAEEDYMKKLAKKIVDEYKKANPEQLSGDSIKEHRERFVAIRKKFNEEFQPKTNPLIEGYIRTLPIISNE